MYQVLADNNGGYSFKIKAKEHSFTVDMKGESGAAPPDVLLASLASCIGVYLRKYAEGAKLNIEGFSVEASADFSKEQPVCFRKISVNIDLKGARLDERRLQAMLSFIKNCPVHNTLENAPQIEMKIGGALDG